MTLLICKPGGTCSMPIGMPSGVPSGMQLRVQWVIRNAAAICHVALSDARVEVTRQASRSAGPLPRDVVSADP